jgi:hypothetical protein
MSIASASAHVGKYAGAYFSIVTSASSGAEISSNSPLPSESSTVVDRFDDVLCPSDPSPADLDEI